MKELMSIKGELGIEEGMKLYDLAKNLEGEGCVVEIGSYFGRSTTFLATGIKHSTEKREKVYTIDIQKRPDLIKNLKEHDVSDYVEIIVSSSQTVKWDKPIRVLFIDGDHSYGSLKADFNNFEPHVIKGGIIAIHDIQENVCPNGPFQFLREILNNKRFELLEYIERDDWERSMAIIKKVI